MRTDPGFDFVCLDDTIAAGDRRYVRAVFDGSQWKTSDMRPGTTGPGFMFASGRSLRQLVNEGARVYSRRQAMNASQNMIRAEGGTNV